MKNLFDTEVQCLKYKVLYWVSKYEWEDTLRQNIFSIPKNIVPGNVPTMRCCVYKERAILEERVKLALGGDSSNPNVVEVLGIACDECPVGGYEVTDACRGCLSHRCERACPREAIKLDIKQKAHIDKTKCIECGACAEVCAFSAIVNYKRPCEKACHVNAISMSDTKEAQIDNDKCISCGACVYQCPFGAISEKSFIVDAVKLLKKSRSDNNFRVHAVVAPAIAGQFVYSTYGKVISGLRELGFASVTEAAAGADEVAVAEARELKEKGKLINSCCPALVKYIDLKFPELKQYVSENPSPMLETAKMIKAGDPGSAVVFIGPCIAKKSEYRDEKSGGYVDCVLTFEELQALFDSREIDINSLEDADLFDASYFGRLFARSGGLTEAIKEGLAELGSTDFDFCGAVCSGIDECRVELLKMSKNAGNVNFIEGMACKGGCVGGAGNLTHSARNKHLVDIYASKGRKTIGNDKK